MKHLKQTALRKTILLLTAIILVACMAVAFVACNNGDGDDEGFSIAGIDSAVLENLLTGGMGYIDAHKTEYPNCYLNCDYHADGEDYDGENIPSILSAGVSLFDYNDPSHAFSCQLMFFRTEQRATESFDFLKDYYGDSAIVTRQGRVIVLETKEGVYRTIRTTAFPQDDISLNEQLQFYKNALQKELTVKNSAVEASYSGNDFDGAFYLVTTPAKGNMENRYVFGPTQYFIQLGASALLDTDSYDFYSREFYTKTVEDKSYAYLRLKQNFLFTFDLERSEYYVNNYFYEEAPTNLVIPATYKNKPVAGISYLEIPEATTTISIPTSVTSIFGNGLIFYNAENLNTINYQGTKEEWDNLHINSVYLEGITVNYGTYSAPSDGETFTTEESFIMLERGEIKAFSISTKHSEIYVSANLICIEDLDNDKITILAKEDETVFEYKDGKIKESNNWDLYLDDIKRSYKRNITVLDPETPDIIDELIGAI